MERRIDFSRERQMLCGRCDHRWRVDLDWIDRWEQAKETCPGCGMTCEHEDSPRVTLDSGDPALDDDRVAQFSDAFLKCGCCWCVGYRRFAVRSRSSSH